MPMITPHLWFATHAVEAAELYAATFPDSRITDVTTVHDTPSGDTDVVSFQLWGQPFVAISAGPLFELNPSVSFLVSCDTVAAVDALWERLSEGGAPLMPLDAYPFSDRYGWVADRYGVSWQIMHTGPDAAPQRITPTLLFVGDVAGRAEEAIAFYISVFPDSDAGPVVRYGAHEEPDVAGTVKHARFRLDGQEVAAMDSALDHRFGFNEAISFMVSCETQEEIDHYWRRLSAVPDAERCGWLKDRYGLSWQVVPSGMAALLRTGTAEQSGRVTAAFLAMGKLDLAELQRAYDGS